MDLEFSGCRRCTNAATRQLETDAGRFHGTWIRLILLDANGISALANPLINDWLRIRKVFLNLFRRSCCDLWMKDANRRAWKSIFSDCLHRRLVKSIRGWHSSDAIHCDTQRIQFRGFRTDAIEKRLSSANQWNSYKDFGGRIEFTIWNLQTELTSCDSWNTHEHCPLNSNPEFEIQSFWTSGFKSQTKKKAKTRNWMPRSNIYVEWFY